MSVLGRKAMQLTLFMTIGILGCDVLIYFLFQWTLGEKRRTRKRRCGAKRRIVSGQESQLFVVAAQDVVPAQRATVLPSTKREPRKPSLPECAPVGSRPIDEETAYRLRAAAFASPKQDSKSAV